MNPEKFPENEELKDVTEKKIGKREKSEAVILSSSKKEIEEIANDILRLQEAKKELEQEHAIAQEKIEEESLEVYDVVAHRTKEMLEKASHNPTLLANIRQRLLKEIFPLVLDSGLSLELLRVVLSDDESKAPSKFVLLNPERIPKIITNILFDVSGTITKADKLTEEIKASIFGLLDRKIYLNFITGRDARWTLKNFAFLKDHPNNQEYVRLWAECGLFNMDTEGVDLQQHELVEKSHMDDPILRSRVSALFYNAKDLHRYEVGDIVPAGYYVGGDAERNLYLIPKDPKVPIPWYIWADSKQKMMAAEMIRDISFSVTEKSVRNQRLSMMILESYFEDWEYNDKIFISPTGTSIDFLPKIKGGTFGVGNSSGAAIRRLSQITGQSFADICAQTIAFGDSSSDLKLAGPFVDDEGKEKGSVAMFFVGRYNQFTPGKEFSDIVAISPGVINDNGEIGVNVTSKMLKSLEGRFSEK